MLKQKIDKHGQAYLWSCCSTTFKPELPHHSNRKSLSAVLTLFRFFHKYVSLQKLKIGKYLEKEVERLLYFMKRMEMRGQEKNSMEAEEQRKKMVSLTDGKI